MRSTIHKHKSLITRYCLAGVVVLTLLGPLAQKSRGSFILHDSEQFTVNSFHSTGTLYDTSRASIVSGGSVSNLYAYDFSVLDISGGNVSWLRAYDWSSVNISGGSVDYYLYAKNSSTVSISAGTLWALSASDSSAVNISGGSVSSGLYAGDSSAVDISGGYVQHLSAQDWSTMNISGASVTDLYAYDSSAVNISGGNVVALWAYTFSDVAISGGSMYSLGAYGSSAVELSGGSVDYLYAKNSSTVTFYGQNFRAAGGLVFDGDRVLGTGTLIGEWTDGTRWAVNIPKNDPTATILAISGSATYYVNAQNGNDNNTGLTPQTAFATIQKGIDSAEDGATVAVLPGTYTGAGNRDLDFKGKPITVRSENPNDPNVVAATIIDCNGTAGDPHRGFYFHSGEDANSILDGFTITNGYGPNEPFGASAYSAGGAIYCISSSPTIRNCVFANNYSHYWGGAVHCDNSSAVFSECTFKENVSFDTGGGLYNRISSITVTNCLFTDNSAAAGGGMYNIDGTSTVKNTIFVGNSAAIAGGGLRNKRVASTIANCTFFDNQSPAGGAVHNVLTEGTTIANCILWDNPDTEIEGDAEVTYCDVKDGWPGEGNIDADPCFAEPNTGDYHLLSESPCIDAGDPNHVAYAGETDLDGHPRILDGRIDIGADEYYVGILHVSVDSPNDPGAGTSENPFRRIQAGIDKAHEGATVIVAPGIYYENISIDGKNIILTSSDANDPNLVGSTIIDGGRTDTVVVFQNGVSSNCILRGFTITNGYSMLGGGIRCVDASPTISRCVIRENRCRGDGGGIGGSNSYPTITHCVVTLNFAAYNEGWGYGGGIFGCDGPINYCSIENNQVDYEGGGGGLAYCDGVISNCVIADNWSSYDDGGGLWGCGGDISNCVITGNVAWMGTWGAGPVDGGGLSDCSGAITNCVIANNVAKNWADECEADARGGGLARCNGPISNCVIASNEANSWAFGSAGGGLWECSGTIKNSIILGNTASANPDLGSSSAPNYSCIQGWGGGGTGNIAQNPCFADAEYHLQCDSPCVDAGDPQSPVGYEPFPNGGIINMGAYGGTPEAAKSCFGGRTCEIEVDGDINGDCRIDAMDLRLMVFHWIEDIPPSPPPCETIVAGDLNDDCNIDFDDFCLMALHWCEDNNP
jgi:hypothetical protein